MKDAIVRIEVTTDHIAPIRFHKEYTTIHTEDVKTHAKAVIAHAEDVIAQIEDENHV